MKTKGSDLLSLKTFLYNIESRCRNSSTEYYYIYGCCLCNVFFVIYTANANISFVLTAFRSVDFFFEIHVALEKCRECWNSNEANFEYFRFIQVIFAKIKNVLFYIYTCLIKVSIHISRTQPLMEMKKKNVDVPPPPSRQTLLIRLAGGLNFSINFNWYKLV